MRGRRLKSGRRVRVSGAVVSVLTSRERAPRCSLLQSVRATLERVTHALQGRGVLVTVTQPVRFQFEHADVRASNIERRDHDSQLQHFLFRSFLDSRAQVGSRLRY